MAVPADDGASPGKGKKTWSQKIPGEEGGRIKEDSTERVINVGQYAVDDRLEGQGHPGGEQ